MRVLLSIVVLGTSLSSKSTLTFIHDCGCMRFVLCESEKDIIPTFASLYRRLILVGFNSCLFVDFSMHS